MRQQNESLFRWEEYYEVGVPYLHIVGVGIRGGDVRCQILYFLSGPVFFCNLYTFQYKCHQSIHQHHGLQCLNSMFNVTSFQKFREYDIHTHPFSAVYFYSASGLGWVAGNLIFSHSQMIS